MATDKPLISILMAVYEPRMDWLEEQLISLDGQTYPNVRLYVRDDASPTVPFEDIYSCVKKTIHSFPFEVQRNERNLGSNGTFERMTQEADGDYFAYCDQDDIWLPEKLSVLESTITREQALLVCSDMYIINGEGKQVADSITKIRRHHIFKNSVSSASELLFHNYVTGCTMLVKASAAKRAVPFCPYLVHDWYLALCCAEAGRVIALKTPLIRYRVHDTNQTLLMSGVNDKASYQQVRIDTALLRFQWMRDHFPCGEDTKQEILEGLAWLQARQKNWRHQGGKRTIWKYRRFSLMPSLFEIVADRIPEPLFQMILRAAKNNVF